jgi:hypothetical protein
LTGTQRLRIQNERPHRRIEKRRTKIKQTSRKLSSNIKSLNISQNYLDPRNKTIFYEENSSYKDRRQLRLKWSEKSFLDKNKNQILDFIPEIHTLSTKKRLKQYHAVYRIIPPDLKNELDVINEKLKTYGYSLDEGMENWYKKSKTVFDTWSTKNLN